MGICPQVKDISTGFFVRQLTERKDSLGPQRARWFEFEPSLDAAGASPCRTSHDDECRETLECVLQELWDGNRHSSSRGVCLNLLRHLARARLESIKR